MTLSEAIDSAETKYRQNLENYFIGIWGRTNLPSHDLNHHKRVWFYAKELLKCNAGPIPSDIQISPEKLIIACYLHDSGMALNTGHDHGVDSKKLCRQFLAENGLKEEDNEDLLSAVEYHDRKDYTGASDPGTLLSYLTTADDLDAFGYIGIYRYIEIYLKRGVKPGKLGYMISENASRRYDNLKKMFPLSPELLKEHQARFQTLRDFFENYSKQADNSAENKGGSSGYLSVVNLISDIAEDKTSFSGLFSADVKFSDDPVVKDFINHLSEELSFFDQDP